MTTYTYIDTKRHGCEIREGDRGCLFRGRCFLTIAIITWLFPWGYVAIGAAEPFAIFGPREEGPLSGDHGYWLPNFTIEVSFNFFLPFSNFCSHLCALGYVRCTCFVVLSNFGHILRRLMCVHISCKVGVLLVDFVLIWVFSCVYCK